MFYPKYKTFNDVIGQPLATIEQWAFEANLRLFDGCIEDVSGSLEVALQDCLEDWKSRDLLSSFDMACLDSAELRESLVPVAGEGSHLKEKICYVRRAAIHRTLAMSSGNRAEALKILGIDDRLCNRLLFEAEVEDIHFDDELAESLRYVPLTAEEFERTLGEYDSQRDGDWFDPSSVSKRTVYDQLTTEAAALIVESGLNVQLEWCHEINFEVAEVLSKHRGGLSIGLNRWDMAVAKCFGQIGGELHVEDLDLKLWPQEDWESGPIDERWYTELIEKFVRQGTTDYPFVRHLTGTQTLPFGKLNAPRLVLPSLVNTWHHEDTPEFPECSLKDFHGKQILVFWDEESNDDFAIELSAWGGEIVTNARVVRTG